MPLTVPVAARPATEQCHPAVPPLRTLLGRRISWGLATARGSRRRGR
ncbi:hypothetical protein [Streptomyces sp. Ru72]|nr:hypothetical protein [Streptomyces sp. Ru72]